jgi:hypothetical protein
LRERTEHPLGGRLAHRAFGAPCRATDH